MLPLKYTHDAELYTIPDNVGMANMMCLGHSELSTICIYTNTVVGNWQGKLAVTTTVVILLAQIARLNVLSLCYHLCTN